jgi:hypothetical protein
MLTDRLMDPPPFPLTADSERQPFKHISSLEAVSAKNIPSGQGTLPSLRTLVSADIITFADKGRMSDKRELVRICRYVQSRVSFAYVSSQHATEAEIRYWRSLVLATYTAGHRFSVWHPIVFMSNKYIFCWKPLLSYEANFLFFFSACSYKESYPP